MRVSDEMVDAARTEFHRHAGLHLAPDVTHCVLEAALAAAPQIAENKRLLAESENWKRMYFEQHRDADRAILELVAIRKLAALALRSSEPGIALIALQSMLPDGPGSDPPVADDSRLAAIRRMHDAIDRIWAGEPVADVYAETLREAAE